MGWIDANAVRIVAYAVVAAVLLWTWRREQRGMSHFARWPRFWLFTALLIAVMGLARAVDLDELAAALGRGEARAAGWYDTRRLAQALAVGGICAAWVVAVTAALWRVPERRRHLLPSAIAVLSLICYVAVRMISLHQVDALLYDGEFGGVRYGAMIELSMLTGIALLGARRSWTSALW